MGVQDRKVLCLGILCLIGGLLLTYFGYFVYPEYLLAAAGLAGPLAWVFPLLLLFLGIGITHVTLKS